MEVELPGKATTLLSQDAEPRDESKPPGTAHAEDLTTDQEESLSLNAPD